jgi:hypothetical protein
MNPQLSQPRDLCPSFRNACKPITPRHFIRWRNLAPRLSCLVLLNTLSHTHTPVFSYCACSSYRLNCETALIFHVTDLYYLCILYIPTNGYLETAKMGSMRSKPIQAFERVCHSLRANIQKRASRLSDLDSEEDASFGFSKLFEDPNLSIPNHSDPNLSDLRHAIGVLWGYREVVNADMISNQSLQKRA